MMRLAAVLLVVLAVVGLFLMSQAGQTGGGEPRKREAFAADRAGPRVEVDVERAMDYLKKICAIGPRISGTDGMKKQQELLQKHFEELGGKVEWQRFTAKQRSRKEPIEMANLVVSWHPERPRRILLCSHYDTRPIADQEPDPRQWHKPFVSANDGGSGVALLMELAHHLKDLPMRVGVDLVCFDGEEYVFDPSEGGDLYFFGSEHFARTYRGGKKKVRYQAAILLDMIAGKNARFTIEQHSWTMAGPLVRDVWQIAAVHRCTAFQNQLGGAVNDDHLALNRAGIPTVDIIDFNYMQSGHWHRLSDVPGNCSADTLAQVARVVTVWMQNVK